MSLILMMLLAVSDPSSAPCFSHFALPTSLGCRFMRHLKSHLLSPLTTVVIISLRLGEILSTSSAPSRRLDPHARRRCEQGECTHVPCDLGALNSLHTPESQIQSASASLISLIRISVSG
ncbi:hypothetical protein C8F04DRAFT_1111345 [Mycena alexandri]|uniref:Secreted protein n=1 Tax=Mycena alexandri TaxID=1745969 RepID=A0AAD6WZS0_9AGAR|nr:hypothetical protein C8F04DRAFT_1111345 [Mycena alexandri]